MELKDFIHFLLGCECAIQGGEGTLTLTGVSYDDTQKIHWCYFENTDLGYAPVDKVKPLLRPLSDMTPNEFIELFKQVSLIDLSECYFDIGNDDGNMWINAEYKGMVIDALKIESGDCVMMQNNDGSFSPINPQAETIAFFLSKGFNLFDKQWKYCIDKTKLATI